MARDGSMRGGARMGSGQKKKPLNEKLLDGNPGNRRLTMLALPEAPDLFGEVMPTPKALLSSKQKGGKDLEAVAIYEETWRWIDARGCIGQIPKQLIEQYAMSVSRWIQCEECISEYGFLAKHPTTGNAMMSPYVSASQTFMKQASNLWFQIYQVVRENCTTDYTGKSPQDDVMERLLNWKIGRTT